MGLKAVAVLEVMWDWEARTSEAGYAERAPPCFMINPRNFTGKRLYDFLGERGKPYDSLWVTNACPELVNSASGRGKPDPEWLSTNLRNLQPFDLLLVCGRVAQNTYRLKDAGDARIIEMPHPAARTWRTRDLAFARRIIQEGKSECSLEFRDGRLVASALIPF